MTEKSIYELDLHETTYVEDIDATIIRVPGGWIYQFRYDLGSVFVEYHNGFYKQVQEEKDDRMD
jgi:hypothetical protein